MRNFIDSLRKLMPNIAAAQAEEFEKVPGSILAKNVEFLMNIKEIKSNQALSDKIYEISGLELSKSQISRVRKNSSDATGLTVFKLGSALCNSAEDYHYLYDINGFDVSGEPIGKYISVDESVIEDSISDAYTSLASETGDINLKQMVTMALIGYRAKITNDYSNLQRDLINAVKSSK